MKLRRVQLTIPRHQSGDGQPMAAIILPDVREKPVRELLVAMLVRLYNSERRHGSR